MLDLLMLLTMLPDAVIGAYNHPKTALMGIVLVIIVCVVTILYVDIPKETNESQHMQSISTPDEAPIKERRITKIAKWLWHKE